MDGCELQFDATYSHFVQLKTIISRLSHLLFMFAPLAPLKVHA